MMSGILSTASPSLGNLHPVILALIAVERLGSTETPHVSTGWNDVEALGTPTGYSVHVERYRFRTTEVRNPASYPILQDPVTRAIVTFERSLQARDAPMWNTHNIGSQLAAGQPERRRQTLRF